MQAEPHTSNIINPNDEWERKVRVIIDLGYSWPNEKKPAKERQGAVVKQISNFVEQVKKHQDKYNLPPLLCCGKGVAEVKDRLDKLSPFVMCDTTDVFDREVNDNITYIYLSPDADEFLDISKGCPMLDSSYSAATATTITANGTTQISINEAICASAAAPAAFNEDVVGAQPGNSEKVVFIVGGIVDRAVKQNRSKSRAMEKQVKSAQLPLGDDNGQPLNIDTVLTMLYYWFAFDLKDRQQEEKLEISTNIAPEQQPRNDENSIASTIVDAANMSHRHTSNKQKDRSGSFIAARHCAFYEHRQRHPNQPPHILK
jgi:hypothetical protein